MQLPWRRLDIAYAIS